MTSYWPVNLPALRNSWPICSRLPRISPKGRNFWKRPWFTREIPGTYVRLGVRDPVGPTLDLHAGHFDVDERAIALGVRLLVGAVHEHFATDPT